MTQNQLNPSRPLYVSEKKISQLYDIPLPTLRNQRRRGVGLPYVKHGRLVRYSLRDVEVFFEARKIKVDQI
jgi:hypothetical protein